MSVLDEAQAQFIEFARRNDIEYADATNGLPLESASAEVLYSSHMLEHLDRSEAEIFLREALRVLGGGGFLRIAVPDIRQQVEEYIQHGDADKFVERTHMCVPRARSLGQRLALLLVGNRNHQWMYDGASLSRLLHDLGFINAQVMPAGETNIPDHQELNLRERDYESVYVEAQKP